MDWKRESAEELREYEAKKAALRSLPEDIAQLKAERKKLGCSTSDSAPVKGGGSVWEDRQINLIAKQEKMEFSLAVARAWVKRVEKGLALLSEEERLILDRFFIAPQQKGDVDRLCEELCLEKTAVYMRRDRALRHYTLARYGCVEV